MATVIKHLEQKPATAAEARAKMLEEEQQALEGIAALGLSDDDCTQSAERRSEYIPPHEPRELSTLEAHSQQEIAQSLEGGAVLEEKKAAPPIEHHPSGQNQSLPFFNIGDDATTHVLSFLRLEDLAKYSATSKDDQSDAAKAYKAYFAKQKIMCSGGSYHSFALISGRVFAWGNGSFGRLGLGDNNYRNCPTEITGAFDGEAVVLIAAGNSHSLAITTSGRVFAWGSNTYGQLGLGDYKHRYCPTEITGAFGGEVVTSIAAGNAHSLAITTSGRVFAWGNGSFGRLGLGDKNNRNTPTEITGAFGDEKVASIAAGGTHSLAITTSGRVFVWGYGGEYGLLGLEYENESNRPAEITGAFGGEVVTSIAAGIAHSLAITKRGRVFAWGYGGEGRLGLGDKNNRNTPTEITGAFGDEKVASIVVGGHHSLAITTSGRVFAWGAGQEGQLGLGDKNNRNTPTEITGAFGGEAVASIATGDTHSLAITKSGRVFAWGSSRDGQLGLGDKYDRSNPTLLVHGLPNVSYLATPPKWLNTWDDSAKCIGVLGDSFEQQPSGTDVTEHPSSRRDGDNLHLHGLSKRGFFARNPQQSDSTPPMIRSEEKENGSEKETTENRGTVTSPA